MEGLLPVQWSWFDVRCIPMCLEDIWETDTESTAAVEKILHAIEVLVIHFQKSLFSSKSIFSWNKFKKIAFLKFEHLNFNRV